MLGFYTDNAREGGRILETIFNRRSIRKYSDEKVSDEDIKKIIKAGMAAPCCKGSKEWVFVVMKKPELFKRYLEAHPYALALETAPVTVLVCADIDLELEPGQGWWIQDCAAAVENMLIEATDLGLGSLWLPVHPKEDRINVMREVCKLPENVEPFALVTLGVSQENRVPNDSYIEDAVFEDEYGKKF